MVEDSQRMMCRPASQYAAVMAAFAERAAALGRLYGESNRAVRAVVHEHGPLQKVSPDKRNQVHLVKIGAHRIPNINGAEVGTSLAP